MEIYIAEQVRLLCGAAALGAALGLAYDLLRAVRRRIPALLIPCDLLFCAAVAAGVIGYALAAGDGELRLYLLLERFWAACSISASAARRCARCGTSGWMRRCPSAA